MKIVSVYFDYGYDKRYSMLARVLEYSVKKYCPLATFELIKLDAPSVHGSKSFASNTVKLDCWVNVLKTAKENILFLDCDMIVLSDLFNVFFDDFDIGYTKRSETRIPYNGGMIMVRNSQAAHDFMFLWQQINEKMYKDKKLHAPWRAKYAGMNQAAFGYIMENEKFDAKLKEFPCNLYNACDEDWRKLNHDVKAIHIKSNLRRAVFTNNLNTIYRRAIIIWRNLAIEAGLIKSKKLNIDYIPPKTIEIENNPLPPPELPEKFKHPHIRKVSGLRRRIRGKNIYLGKN